MSAKDIANANQKAPIPDGLWSLPSSWTWAKLGRLGSWMGGGTPAKNNPTFWTNGTIPWVSPKDMKHAVIGDTIDKITAEAVEASATNLVPTGSVLMVMRSGILRRRFPVAITNRVVTLNQDLRAFVPLKVLDPSFLAWYLSCVGAHVLQTCSKDGTTVDSIDSRRLDLLSVPVAPLPEQKRIVARIDALFAEIEAGEAALASARRSLEVWRRALLKAAVTGELTRDWRERNTPRETGQDLLARLREACADERRRGRNATAGVSVEKSSFRELPPTWSWAVMTDVGDTQLGQQRAPQHHRGEHLRPYLRVANVLDDRLDLSDVKEMNFLPETLEHFELASGDILLNEGQTPDLLGRSAMYRGEIEGCCFQKTLLRFRSFEGIENEWALLVFRHYMYSGRFRRESRITTNIGHLTKVRFIAMEFPVPPVEEQREIVKRFREGDGVDDNPMLVEQPAAIDSLRQAVLSAAFRGDLVLQDPDDEPAATVLAALPASAPPRRRAGRRKVASS